MPRYAAPRSATFMRKMVESLKVDEKIVSNEFIYTFFGKCRQTLEALDYASEFPKLKMFCDLMLHDKLSYSKHFSAIRVINDFLHKYDSAFGEVDPRKALDTSDIYLELRRFLRINDIDLYGIDSHIIIVPALRAIDGNDISCVDKVTNARGEISVEKARQIGVGGSLTAVLSFGIRRWTTRSNLELFNWLSRGFVPDGDKMILYTGAFAMGACLNCGSYEVPDVSIGEVCQCSTCGSHHIVSDPPEFEF